MWFQNCTTVLNRKESFHIKEFMKKEKGCPEIVSSSFPNFGERSFSIVFNPLMLLDPTFILIGTGVVLVAVLEKQLANNGFIFIAATISSALRIAFPIVAVGSMIYLLSQLSFL
jgi:hypothetical protein